MSEIKRQIRDYWDKVPCGTGDIDYPEGTLEYYEAVSRNRYHKEFFLADFAEFDKWKDKKVLEVGCGAGSDLIEFAKQGAIVTGIDLSPKSVALTQKRLEVYGLKGEVKVGDAEGLPFKDNTFDVLYSCGVLHHTPNMERAVNEVYRVLKPNGEIRIMLYHKPSMVCLQMWVLFALLKGNPFRNLDEIFSQHHESVGTKVLTVKDTHKLFRRFKNVEIKTITTLHDIRYARNKYLPNYFIKLVPNSLGWNILIKGNK